VKTQDIENIELVFLSMDDYGDLKEAMIEAYSNMPKCLLEGKTYQITDQQIPGRAGGYQSK
jgi:hypothetical protein